MPSADKPPSDALPAPQRRGFHLTRYFTIASLVAFAIVVAVVFALQLGEESFFDQAQREHLAHLTDMQQELAAEHFRSDRTALVSVHEAGHVNLARALANAVGPAVLATYFAAAQRATQDLCRAPGQPASERRSCQEALRTRLLALPGFAAIDRVARSTMRGTTVFKIKMFDARGLTVYSSDPAQVGEDKRDNAGWQAAAAGTPASEMTHRDQFSAFEGVVENRDLISTYVPIREPDGARIAGVFEIYSDVTPFLAQVAEATERTDRIAAKHRSAVERLVVDNRRALKGNSREFLSIVYGMLAALFLVLLAIVRNGQRIIDRQERAREEAATREKRSHAEKMAALSTMASGIAHEVGNPLTIIAGVAHEIATAARDGEAARGHAKLILEQTSRISAMTHEIAEFAASRGDVPEWVDVNAIVASVCGFVRHDRRLSTARIAFEPGDGVPAASAIPDQLMQVLIELLPRVALESGPGQPGGSIVVATRAADSEVRIEMRLRGAGDGAPRPFPVPLSADELQRHRERMAGMNGDLRASDDVVVLALRAASPEADRESAVA